MKNNLLLKELNFLELEQIVGGNDENGPSRESGFFYDISYGISRIAKGFVEWVKLAGEYQSSLPSHLKK